MSGNGSLAVKVAPLVCVESHGEGERWRGGVFNLAVSPICDGGRRIHVKLVAI